MWAFPTFAIVLLLEITLAKGRIKIKKSWFTNDVILQIYFCFGNKNDMPKKISPIVRPTGS
ncbi:hypothetical protein GCM10009001_11030 [Virgibacillus siamensis]|uniref:Uncharacterized protein n=1 Tax=Virgibacillus siamensis TaxID=480071 RepID=A0ABN1FSA5_9BACI